MPPIIRSAALLLLALAAPPALAAQRGARVLDPQALLGQQVPLLPLTLVIADSASKVDTAWAPWADRTDALRRADSVVSEAFLERAPEVRWILPPELRKLARRGVGFVTDPDRMGQAVMRSPKLTQVPESFRAQLRNLVAMTEARFAMVPAAIAFSRDTTGAFRSDLAMVLVDARNGRVLWRTTATGRGAAPTAALASAIATVFPPVTVTETAPAP